MKQQDFLQLPLTPGQKLLWTYRPEISPSIVLSQLLDVQAQPGLIIVPNSNLAATLVSELNFFQPDDKLQILHFPNWETLPYDNLSPHSDLISERLTTLKYLRSIAKGLVIVTVGTLMQRLMPVDFLDKFSLILQHKQRLDLSVWREQLVNAGYYAVDEVHEHGEFAVRGSIVDIFPMGAQQPYRLDLFDHEIDSIRTFSPDTQLSLHEIAQIDLLPAKEFPFDANAIELFRQAFRERFSGNPMQFSLYQDVSQGIAPPGIEYYLPLFTRATTSLYNYLPDNIVVVGIGDLASAANNFWREIHQRYHELSQDLTRPLLKPEEIFFAPTEVLDSMDNYPAITLQTSTIAHPLKLDLAPNLLFDQYQSGNADAVAHAFAQITGRILFSVSRPSQRELVLKFLQRFQIRPVVYNTWQEFLAADERYSIIVAPLVTGFCLVDLAITVLPEQQLFSKIAAAHAIERPQNNPDFENFINNLTQLKLGDLVVHLHYGVARYQGLHILKTGDLGGEFLCLEYRDDDKLYVPIASLALISRYSGINDQNVPLSSLKNDHWQKTKQKVSRQIRDVASELLNIYSKRALQTKTPMHPPNEDYDKFVADFPFLETKDQHRAITEVIADMTSTQAMDRLVCGDVGFGKTEVAMRAAFLAVQNNQQVVLLVPTTLLAQQHYQSLQDRFADWPIRIAMLSRISAQNEQKKLIDQVAQGSIDILIGTHKILQKNIKFKQLGLVIVDEEHLFGVKQKEYLKTIRASVDILTLTATPIPRTLNMSLAGIRNLSIIATPPERRLAIKTFIYEYQPKMLQEAIQRELLRGGQVFFVHNEIASIADIAQELGLLLPEARIAVAHGQIKARALEKIMTDFYHRNYNVLVCTTIIESGIDMPNANTIIINNADNFGLAQLYQLRGRVGRSHHQAYAYLFIKSRKLLTSEAKQRLDALACLEELGSGFMLATHDLEIRGAGALLGEQQSGNMNAVGFSLYNDILARTIEALKAGELIPHDLTWYDNSVCDVTIDLQLTALIPDRYLADVVLRLQFYKRIASADSVQSLDDLQVEMIDRFGLLPQELKNLFAQSELKLIMLQIGATKLLATAAYAKLEFGDKPHIKPEKLVQLIQDNPEQYQLVNNQQLKYNLPAHDMNQRVQLLLQWLTELQQL